MNYSRREFLKHGLKASAAISLALKGFNAQAQGLSIDLSSLMDITRFVVPDPVTLSYSVGSPCCEFCYDKFVVHHYQPVAFIEVTRGPTDSFASAGAGSILNSTVSSDGKEHHSFSARVWDLPQISIDLAFGLQACRLCGKPGGPTLPPGDSVDVGALQQLTDTLCSTPMGIVAEQMQKALNDTYREMASSMPGEDCIPAMLYDSAEDQHWRSGCRDITMASATGPLCDLAGATGLNISDMAGFPGNPCVGGWGSVYPRQMRVINQDSQTAAALTAYRAIHVAKNVFGTFPYDVSLRGKLQQTIPNPVTGFSPGTNKVIYNAGRTTPINGRWIFVWWVPVSCCKDIEEILGLCPPPVPCMG